MTRVVKNTVNQFFGSNIFENEGISEKGCIEIEG